MKKMLLAGIVTGLFSLSVVAAEPLVTWRNHQLTQEDYQGALQQIPPEHQYEFQVDLKRITSLLENTLVFRTLAAEARAGKLDQDPVVRKEIELLTERILATKHLEAFEKTIKVPDMRVAAEEHFRIEQAKYNVPDAVQVAHILISPARHGGDAGAQARADEARQKLTAGADFAEIVATYSDDDRTAKRGGELAPFGAGAMVEAFEKAAFALQNPGDISPVVKTEYGLHIIRLVKKIPGRKISFEEAKPRILRQLEEQYIGQKKAEYIAGIKNDPTIKLNTAEIDKLKKEHPMSTSNPATNSKPTGK